MGERRRNLHRPSVFFFTHLHVFCILCTHFLTSLQLDPLLVAEVQLQCGSDSDGQDPEQSVAVTLM